MQNPGQVVDPKIENERIRTKGLGFKLPRSAKQLFPLSRLAAPGIHRLICHRSPARSNKAYSSKMGVKARKKAITKKLKKGASDFSASSASKDEARDFLPLEGGPAQKLPKTEVRENKGTVLYIGRIPHGFYENEMEGFFKQFGTIKRLRIARNKKTGKSKHFGFIEFESPEVAKVVADTMHNYLLFEHLLQVQLIPPEHVHPRLWKGVNRWYKPLDWVNIERKRQDKERTLDDHKKLVEGILKRDKKRRKRIEAAGIDYECPEMVGSIQAAPKKIRFDAD